MGIHYWNFSAPGDPQRIADTLAAAAKTAEEAGVAEFGVMDHYFMETAGRRARNSAIEANQFVRRTCAPSRYWYAALGCAVQCH
jgi:alkanesulfonate monooxygenase SsuD/methylene tetrahydromethanopterin reductase-like flavin-dependent oxidoreductase (luciferase family)